MNRKREMQKRIDDMILSGLEQAMQKGIEAWDGKGNFDIDVRINTYLTETKEEQK